MSKKKTKKQIFVVERVNTFFEVHVVEAENEEMARKIAEHSDYNASKWLGAQNVNVYPYTEEHKARFLHLDSYYFEGYAAVDKDGMLYYMKENGELNGNMPTIKIFETD